MRKRTVSTTIECGAAEITITAEILPGSRGTRYEPGSGPEINGIVGATRSDECRAGRHCPRWINSSSPKHRHDVAVNVDHLESVLGPFAWSEIEASLLDAAANGESDGPDPDAARDA